MADAKRQGATSNTASSSAASTATDGRVATPKVPSASQGSGADLSTTLSKAVGARVQITTSNSKTLEGTLFAADPSTNLVALNTSATSALAPAKLITQGGDFHLLHTTHIHSFKIIALSNNSGANGATSGGASDLSIPRVDLKAVKEKEETAVHRAIVGPEGWAAYDLLSRQFPTRWHETTIVVSDSVLIEKPYKSENCSAPESNHKALEYVRWLLDPARAKGTASQSRNGTPAPTPGRKGG